MLNGSSADVAARVVYSTLATPSGQGSRIQSASPMRQLWDAESNPVQIKLFSHESGLRVLPRCTSYKSRMQARLLQKPMRRRFAAAVECCQHITVHPFAGFTTTDTHIPSALVVVVHAFVPLFLLDSYFHSWSSIMIAKSSLP